MGRKGAPKKAAAAPKEEAEQFSNAITEDDAPEPEFSNAPPEPEFSNAPAEPEFSNAPAEPEFSNEAASEIAEPSQSAPRPPMGTMKAPAAAGPPPTDTVASMRPPTETVASMPPPIETVASMPGTISSEVAETVLEEPAEPEFSNAPVEESSSTPAEASPSSAEPAAPAPAQPPPMCTVAATPAAAAPQVAADDKTENGENKKWATPDMSHIQNRTKDVNNFEARRNTSDESGGLPGAAAVPKGSKDADGKWETVGTGYIDHRTNDPNMFASRRATGDVGSAGALKDAGQQGSATVKKEGDGKWTVDTSYIAHRTGDTANLDRPYEAAGATVYADPAVTKYTYEELIGSERPKDVDPTQKEAYLSDADFQTVFGMGAAAFQKQAGWKQKNAKKAKDLF